MPDKISNYEIVIKLIGRIEPIGDSCVDSIRAKSLEEMIILVDRLIADIAYVARLKIMEQHSVRIAGIKAHSFLLSIKEAIEEQNAEVEKAEEAEKEVV